MAVRSVNAMFLQKICVGAVAFLTGVGGIRGLAENQAYADVVPITRANYPGPPTTPLKSREWTIGTIALEVQDIDPVDFVRLEPVGFVRLYTAIEAGAGVGRPFYAAVHIDATAETFGRIWVRLPYNTGVWTSHLDCLSGGSPYSPPLDPAHAFHWDCSDDFAYDAVTNSYVLDVYALGQLEIRFPLISYGALHDEVLSARLEVSDPDPSINLASAAQVTVTYPSIGPPIAASVTYYSAELSTTVQNHHVGGTIGFWINGPSLKGFNWIWWVTATPALGESVSSARVSIDLAREGISLSPNSTYQVNVYYDESDGSEIRAAGTFRTVARPAVAVLGAAVSPLWRIPAIFYAGVASDPVTGLRVEDQLVQITDYPQPLVQDASGIRAPGGASTFITPAGEWAVAYEKPQGEVHLYKYSSMTGRTEDLSIGGGPAGDDPVFGYTNATDNTMRVVYRSAADQSLHELRNHAGSWEDTNLTAATGAPDGGAPFAYVTPFDHVTRVVYLTRRGTIGEIWCCTPDRAWHFADLTLATGGSAAPLPSASGDPSAYVTPWDSTARVVYVGGLDHLHELRLQPGGTWHDADLTQAAAAPVVVTGCGSCLSVVQNTKFATAYVTPNDNTARVVFFGIDNNIHELWMRQGGTWHDANLTAGTGSPMPYPAAPIGFYDPYAQVARVVYSAEPGGRVIELRLAPGLPWTWTPLTVR